MTSLSTLAPTVNRDQWGRPLITPPGGGKPQPYTRVTTLAGTLEDQYNLTRWKQRQTILGLTRRADLLASAAAHAEDSKQLDKIADAAMEAAESSAGATTGTALHTFTEKLDTGRDVGNVPDTLRPDLDAYTKVTANLTTLAVEQFTVLDDLKVAGTFDRLVEFEGTRYIADLKTGRIDFGAQKIAIQLALYSRAQVYDIPTGARTPLNDVDQDWGIVIHLPAGRGECTLHWVDLAAGWEAVERAAWTRQWRSRKDLMTPVAAHRLTVPTAAAAPPPPPVAVVPTLEQLAEWIAIAPSADALGQLWTIHGDLFTSAHTELAGARHALLVTGAA